MDVALLPSGIELIDTRLGGNERTNCAYLVRGREPIVVETGPTASLSFLREGLKALGVGPEDLAHVVVSHIHLDHAGAVGNVARDFPRARIWVHERGAPHIADPARLVASATRVFGEEYMGRVLGPMDPVPSDRIAAVSGGERISLGDRSLEVVYAPGHASHHIFLVDSDSGALFTGDGFGVLLPDGGTLRPSAPPPEFDLEKAIASIRLVRRRAPDVVLFSHFGPARDVIRVCDEAEERLRLWSEIVRKAMRETDDQDEIVRRLREETAALFPSPEDRARHDLLNDERSNVTGMVRYFKKREESESGKSG